MSRTQLYSDENCSSKLYPVLDGLTETDVQAAYADRKETININLSEIIRSGNYGFELETGAVFFDTETGYPGSLDWNSLAVKTASIGHVDDAGCFVVPYEYVQNGNTSQYKIVFTIPEYHTDNGWSFPPMRVEYDESEAFRIYPMGKIICDPAVGTEEITTFMALFPQNIVFLIEDTLCTPISYTISSSGTNITFYLYLNGVNTMIMYSDGSFSQPTMPVNN